MRIFLSYGHDRYGEMAVELKRELEARGYEVWFDLERLKAGSDWEQYIESGLDWASTGSGRFVLLMTPHSVRRPDGYCLNELARAFARNLRIVPVMVSDVELPLSICRIQWLDMRRGLQPDALIDAIEHEKVDIDGVQARLASLLHPLPYEADRARLLERFEGREWVMRDVEVWLAGNQRVLWITGPAGAGKSALSAWLSERRPEIAAVHYCRFGNSDRMDARKALFSLAYQLSTQLPDYQNRLNALPLEDARTEANVRALFERLFVEPLADLQLARDLVILIDALDECTQDGKNELAALIGSEFTRTPSWLRLIVTSRPNESEVNFALQSLDHWLLDAGRAENIEDIRSYLRRQLADPYPAVVDAIAKKSEGLFLYVNWVREEFKAGRLSLDKVGEFPQGLGGIFAQFFARYFPDRREYGTTWRPVLESICAALEPLAIGDLASLFQWTAYRADEVTSVFGSLFPVFDERMRPFHESVREWLTRDDRANPYRINVREGHKTLADFGMHDTLRSRYFVVHLPTHLQKAGQRENLQNVLLDPDWMQAKLLETDVVTLLADYDLAPEDDALRLLKSAVRLSSNTLSKDPSQFASQIVGRLLPYEELAAVQKFNGAVAQKASLPWLRPLWPALHPAGTPLIRTIEGHSAPITGVAVCPDGRRVVSACDDKTLKVWDLETGRELHTLVGHSGAVKAVAVCPDGTRAVSASEDHTLRVWELYSGRELCLLEGHTRSVTSVAVSPDGRWAISASEDHTLKVWDLDSGRELRTLKEGRFNVISDISFCPCGRRAVSASSYYNQLRIWDLDSGAELSTWELHQGNLKAVAVCPDGVRAVSAAGKALTVWDLDSGRELRVIEGHSDAVTALAIDPAGGRIVSTSMDKTVRIWDLDSGRALRILQGHSEAVTAVAVSPDGCHAVSASKDATLKVWNLNSGQDLQMPERHAHLVSGFAVSSDAQCAVSSSFDNTLKVWDLGSGRCTMTLGSEGGPNSDDGQVVIEMVYGRSKTPQSAGMTTGVGFCPDGRRVLSASADGKLKLWDLDTGLKLRTLDGHAWAVSCAAVCPDNRQALSGSDDGTVKLWDLDTGQELRTFTGHLAGVTSVALCPDGRRFVSGSQDSTIRVWNFDSGQELNVLKGHLYAVSGVAVCAGGRRLVSVSRDGVIKLWDLDFGRELRSPTGESSEFYAVAAHPHRPWAVAALGDKLRVWDLDSLAVMATLTCDAPVTCCAFAGPTRILAGDESGRIHFLALES